MQERLDQSVIGELLGLLAHDLRNPLSALHSNLGFLRSILSAAEADTREAVDDGLVSCDGLAHIIDNIDLLGQSLQGAQDGLDRTPVDVAAIVADVVVAVRSMGQSYGVQIVSMVVPGSSTTGEAHRDLLSRALGNLVRNAIQHSPLGGTVRIALRSGADEVGVVVTDSGSSLGGALEGSAFTALGQLASKSVPNGRYSRGLGLYSAGIAAAAAGAQVRVVAPEGGAGNAFELTVSRAS